MSWQLLSSAELFPDDCAVDFFGLLGYHNVIMSLLNIFRKRAADDSGGVTEQLVVDGVSMASDGNGGTVRPPDQLQILERCGNFSRREKIPVTVLFVGKALRELDPEGRYREVKVVYAENREQMPEILRNILKSANRKNTVVATGSPELKDAAAALGVSSIHEKTLRKALDRTQGERSAGSGRSSRSRGGNGNGTRKNAPPSKADKAANDGKREPEEPSSSIDDLIDRV